MMERTNQLLKRLEPPVRPAYAGEGAVRPAPPIEGRSFGDLLTLVSDGSVSSGRHVTLAFTPRAEVSEAQLARLGPAADVAEAHGAGRALMLIDGRGLLLEVASRQLLAELSERDSDTILTLDAAVYVAGEDDAASGAALGPPRGTLVPRAVAEQLERARDENTMTSHESARRQAG